MLLILAVISGNGCYGQKTQKMTGEINGCWIGNYKEHLFQVLITDVSIEITENKHIKRYVLKSKKERYFFHYNLDEELDVLILNNKTLKFQFDDKKLREDIPALVMIEFFRCK